MNDIKLDLSPTNDPDGFNTGARDEECYRSWRGEPANYQTVLEAWSLAFSCISGLMSKTNVSKNWMTWKVGQAQILW